MISKLFRPYFIYTFGLVVQIAYSQPQVLWEREYDSGYKDEANGVAIDNKGNIIVAGYTCAGDTDFLTLKYTQSGELLWARQFKVEGRDMAYGVATDELDNIIVGGYSIFGYDSLVCRIVKYDSTGEFLWTRTYTSEGWHSAGLKGITTDNDNRIVGTGWISIWPDDPASPRILIIKYSPEGNFVWKKTINQEFGLTGYGVATDSDKNVVVTGGIFLTIPIWHPGIPTYKYDCDGASLEGDWYLTSDFDPNLVPIETGYGITVDRWNNIILTGTYPYIGTHSYDWLTIKYTPDLNVLWAKLYDTGERDEGFGVDVDSFGNVIVVGRTILNGPNILRYSAEGELLWEYSYQGARAFKGVAIDPYNDFIATTTKNDNFLTVKFGELGIEESVKTKAPNTELEIYPNPFSSRAIINYRIPTAEKVSLKVYNCSGELIAILVDTKKETGYHSVDWSSDGLSNGIYFLKLESQLQVINKKVIKLK
ncbi:MAG: T9SS type A sorting domain-containing protein [bacterium]|nr:T9SS type A sorting domain-containing protein [bacterium]